MVDFIKEYQIDTDICRTLIEYFKEHPRKAPGLCGDSEWIPFTKSSTDVPLLKVEFKEDYPVVNYIKALYECTDKYIEEFPECSEGIGHWNISGANIQHYAPKQGYYKWHCERTNLNNVTRHLVFSTFLNSVTDGGHTEFKYQKKSVEAVEGKTIIFPADWTYTHKGRVSETQDKYIITGWFNFIEFLDTQTTPVLDNSTLRR